MDFPINFHIGSVTILSHPLFEWSAFAFGFWYYKYLKQKKLAEGFPDKVHWNLVIGMIIGAFVGSRLIAGLEDPTLFVHPLTWLYYVGSQTILGGILGGIIGVEVFKKISKHKSRTGDAFVFPLILGIMIGRVGCFLTGVTDGTVGLPSYLPWALDQGDGILRHPTSLYEIVFLLVLFFVLRYIGRSGTMQRLWQGDLFRIFVVSYCGFRFFVEFIKPIKPLVFGLSSIQLAAFVGMIYYLLSFIFRKKNQAIPVPQRP